MATKQQLNRLEQITNLRDVWDSEAGDFTPWLAEKANLDLLGDTIGLELELESVEKDVGPFRADILCRDTADGSWVLVENQLERTDHTHLGQILTYAAGLKAVTIVWIAKRFTNEHQATLEWLNDMTGGGVNFFGLELELWRIGDSAIAPKFNVVAKPNTWVKTQAGTSTGSGAGGRAITEARQLQLEFWTSFREYLLDGGTTLKTREPHAQMCYDFALGKTGYWLSAAASSYTQQGGYGSYHIRVELLGNSPAARQFFGNLKIRNREIEEKLGSELGWDMREDLKTWKMYCSLVADHRNRDEWPAQFAWLGEKLERFYATFRPMIFGEFPQGECDGPEDDRNRAGRRRPRLVRGAGLGDGVRA